MQTLTVEWDDLRLALAVARGRGLQRAARLLNVNPSTVFRRLGALERALGARLFERLPEGYDATAAGERLIKAAERMEAEAASLDRDIAGRDHRLCGLLRVTATESVAERLLLQPLAAFRRRHPGIRVELIVESRLLSLTRREADIALRPTGPDQSEYVGRRLADLAWAVYGAPDYLAEAPPLRTAPDLADHALIGWEAGSGHAGVVRWLRALGAESAVVYGSNSILSQMGAAKAGMGLAVLPCFLGDEEAGLCRVLPPIPALSRGLWMVTHRDLRHAARVRAFFEVVGAAIQRARPRLEGRPKESGALSGAA